MCPGERDKGVPAGYAVECVHAVCAFGVCLLGLRWQRGDVRELSPVVRRVRPRRGAEVTVWIDVSGKYPSGWVEGAMPQPGDPTGHTTAAIRDFESNVIEVAILDP